MANHLPFAPTQYQIDEWKSHVGKLVILENPYNYTYSHWRIGFISDVFLGDGSEDKIYWLEGWNYRISSLSVIGEVFYLKTGDDSSVKKLFRDNVLYWRM